MEPEVSRLKVHAMPVSSNTACPLCTVQHAKPPLTRARPITFVAFAVDFIKLVTTAPSKSCAILRDEYSTKLHAKQQQKSQQGTTRLNSENGNHSMCTLTEQSRVITDHPVRMHEFQYNKGTTVQLASQAHTQRRYTGTVKASQLRLAA